MNWINFIPKDLDVQVSRSTDFEACASYSAIYILEMVLKRRTGMFWEFSERYMAKMSDTQSWGNTMQNVVDALNKDGVCLTQYWPELTYSDDYENIDWATYYADIPDPVIKQAYRVSASLKKLNPAQATAALEVSPLWTIVKTSSGQLHLVAQINDTQFFDSYEIKVKNFSDGYPIQSQYLLTFNTINMPNVIFVQKQGTQEAGFYVPAQNEAALIDKAQNFGINILKPDGTIDYSIAKQIQGL